MAALGLDPYRFLDSKDPLERSLITELYNRTIAEREKLMRNQAVMTAQEVSKLFKRKA